MRIKHQDRNEHNEHLNPSCHFYLLQRCALGLVLPPQRRKALSNQSKQTGHDPRNPTPFSANRVTSNVLRLGDAFGSECAGYFVDQVERRSCLSPWKSKISWEDLDANSWCHKTCVTLWRDRFLVFPSQDRHYIRSFSLDPYLAPDMGLCNVTVTISIWSFHVLVQCSIVQHPNLLEVSIPKSDNPNLHDVKWHLPSGVSGAWKVLLPKNSTQHQLSVSK